MATDLRKALIGHPDLFQINLVVGMNQDISHPSHGSPWHTWVKQPQLRTETLRGFANNFKTTDHSILEVIPGQEGLFAVDRVSQSSIEN